MKFNKTVDKVLSFRDERDWKKFHNPKDLAISISIEAAELLEVFQWSASDVYSDSKREQILEELADIFIYCIDLADCIGADIPEIIESKITKNSDKYPIEKSRGNSRKYTEL